MPSRLFDFDDVYRLQTSTNDALINIRGIFNYELRRNNFEYREFYNENVNIDAEDALSIYMDTCDQNTDYWHAQRQIRITGSKAKTLRTAYKSDNPYHRTKSTIFNVFNGNPNTDYGLVNEKEVLRMFRRENKREGTVRFNCGLMINENAPWLGYSPDGFFKPRDFNEDPILLEVKCPQAGRFNSVDNLCSRLNYLEYDCDEDEYVLSESSPYYSQIQLGLTLFNLDLAYLLIYCEKDYDYAQIPVYFDEDFASSMLQDLCEEYIEYYLPILEDCSDRLLIHCE